MTGIDHDTTGMAATMIKAGFLYSVYRPEKDQSNNKSTYNKSTVRKLK